MANESDRVELGMAELLQRSGSRCEDNKHAGADLRHGPGPEVWLPGRSQAQRFRHRQPVVILGRRIALAVEHLRWGG